jgi:hypothetical protein
MNPYLANPIVRGALSGLLAAALVDIHSFRTFKNVDEFAAYDWRLAGFRWFQGAVAGAIAAAGLGAI